MPYDDSNIKKMIRYQTERQVGFSSKRRVTQPCKDLIHRMLDSNIKTRATIPELRGSYWATGSPISPPPGGVTPAPAVPKNGEPSGSSKRESAPEGKSGQGDQPVTNQTPAPAPEATKDNQMRDQMVTTPAVEVQTK